MIKVDNIVIEANQFPDHTLLVKAPVLRGVGELVQIVWNYENDAELFTHICLRKHYRQAWTTDLTMSETSFDRLQNIMINAGELNSKIDFNKVVDNSYAIEAGK